MSWIPDLGTGAKKLVDSYPPPRKNGFHDIIEQRKDIWM
jgi:hypothetical protein